MGKIIKRDWEHKITLIPSSQPSNTQITSDEWNTLTAYMNQMADIFNAFPDEDAIKSVSDGVSSNIKSDKELQDLLRGPQGVPGKDGKDGQILFDRTNAGDYRWNAPKDAGEDGGMLLNHRQLGELAEPYGSDDATTKKYVDDLITQLRDEIKQQATSVFVGEIRQFITYPNLPAGWKERKDIPNNYTLINISGAGNNSDLNKLRGGHNAPIGINFDISYGSGSYGQTRSGWTRIGSDYGSQSYLQSFFQIGTDGGDRTLNIDANFYEPSMDYKNTAAGLTVYTFEYIGVGTSYAKQREAEIDLATKQLQEKIELERKQALQNPIKKETK